MNEHNDTPQADKVPGAGKPWHRRHRGGRWVKAGVGLAILGALAAAGISYASNEGGCHGRFGMGMHGHMDAAAMSKHIDGFVNRVLADGTAEQKSKVGTILKAAATDLEPLHTQLHAGREQAIKLLSQPSIDRDAVEKLRVSQLQLADQASKRITQAVEDAADVLTPEQRIKLAEHLKKRMG
jgi:protein CpxP